MKIKVTLTIEIPDSPDYTINEARADAERVFAGPTGEFSGVSEVKIYHVWEDSE